MSDYHAAKEEALGKFELAWILEMAIYHDANLSEMARQGGLNRTTLWRLMKKHGLSRTYLLELIDRRGSSEVG